MVEMVEANVGGWRAGFGPDGFGGMFRRRWRALRRRPVGWGRYRALRVSGSRFGFR